MKCIFLSWTTVWVDLHKVDLIKSVWVSVHPYYVRQTVHSSIHKKFFSDLNEIWYVDRGTMNVTRRYAVWPDPRSRSRSRRSESSENGRFHSISRPLFYACNQKTNLVNYVSPRQYLNCVWTDVWYSS